MGTALPWLRKCAFLVLTTLLALARAEFSICNAFTTEQGQYTPAFGCYTEPYCCGNVTNKYCCNDCAQAFNSSACDADPWDPTHTIIQCAVLFVAFIMVTVIGILGFNGTLDGRKPRRRAADSEWPQTLVMDPVKGYPVQPSYPMEPPRDVNYTPGDNDIYPVQPGYWPEPQQNGGQQQPATENDNLIVPEITANNASTTDAKLAKMQNGQNGGLKNGGAGKMVAETAESNSKTEAPSTVVVSVKPMAPQPPVEPV